MWPIVSGYCKLPKAMNVSGKYGQSIYVSPVMLPERIHVLVLDQTMFHVTQKTGKLI